MHFFVELTFILLLLENTAMKYRELIGSALLAGMVLETVHAESKADLYQFHTHEEFATSPQGRMIVAVSTVTSSVST